MYQPFRLEKYLTLHAQLLQTSINHNQKIPQSVMEKLTNNSFNKIMFNKPKEDKNNTKTSRFSNKLKKIPSKRKKNEQEIEILFR